MRRQGALPLAGLALLVALMALSGCGADDTSYDDRKIVKALNLEKAEEGFSVGGDPFCIVSDRFFNDAAEVEAAKTDEDTGTVIASRAGHVAVEGIPPFAPDCADLARKRLNRLDPQPDDE